MDTDACEPYSISIPCVPFFACTMRQGCEGEGNPYD